MTYAEVLTALADPTRRNIFEALGKHPMTVRELADGQPVSRPAVSQHLKILETARLVRAVPEGARRVYSLEHEGLEDLRSIRGKFLVGCLSRLRCRNCEAHSQQKEKSP